MVIRLMRDPAPPDVVHVYTTLLERAILELRTRVRYADVISADELHDYLDALHNVPAMLRDYGNWMVEKNIDEDLARYDARWMGKGDSELRTSLVDLLNRCKQGEFDHPYKAGGSG
jgi:hypothetical protein